MYVAEPSVDATISIIRGLKIKYESHHGVRIAGEHFIINVESMSNGQLGTSLNER